MIQPCQGPHGAPVPAIISIAIPTRPSIPPLCIPASLAPAGVFQPRNRLFVCRDCLHRDILPRIAKEKHAHEN